MFVLEGVDRRFVFIYFSGLWEGEMDGFFFSMFYAGVGNRGTCMRARVHA